MKLHHSKLDAFPFDHDDIWLACAKINLFGVKNCFIILMKFTAGRERE